MNCKCGELKTWLETEIKNLNSIKEDLYNDTRLAYIIDAKIDAYTIVLNGLEK